MEDIPASPPDEVDVDLQDAVDSLPTKTKLPFMMQLEGYTVREISESLRVPEGTIKLRLREAKHSLRDQLSGEEVSVCGM